MPAADNAAIACAEKLVTVARWPVTSAARKNSGTPIGTVIAMACPTVPVSTPRRTQALLKANVAAEQTARRLPSTCAMSPALLLCSSANFQIVMRGLDPRIHLFFARWIAGSSPAMTIDGSTTAQKLNASPRAEVGILRHRGPFGDLGLEEGAELVRRAPDEAVAERHRALLDVRQREHPRNVAVDLGDDVLGRAFRREEGEPGRLLLHGDARLLEGRHIRQRLGARMSRHRQRPHLAGLHVAERAAKRREPERDAP